MNGRSIIPWIVLIILICIGFIIFTFGGRKKKTAPPPVPPSEISQETEKNLTNIEPEGFTDKVKENLQLGTSLAKKWKEDAVLVYVQVKINSLTPDEGTETYVFNSPSLADFHYTFTISQKSKRYIRAIIPKEDYLSNNLLPIDFKYWKLNYVSAFQTAEKEGGKEFRERNSDWFVEINLSRGEPRNWLWYEVLYKSNSGNSLSIKINPYSGEVLREGSLEKESSD